MINIHNDSQKSNINLIQRTIVIFVLNTLLNFVITFNYQPLIKYGAYEKNNIVKIDKSSYKYK